MIMGVYAMRDSLSGFMQPTIEQNDAIAVRNFRHAVLNPDSVLFSSAKDFDLCKLGSFDTSSGLITPVPLPQSLVTAQDIRLQEVDSNAV